MSFRPLPTTSLSLDGTTYRLATMLGRPGVPDARAGDQADVYHLLPVDGVLGGNGVPLALKVFRPEHRSPDALAHAGRIAPFAALPGLGVCQRAILEPSRHWDILRPCPELIYAVVMPWLPGPTWSDIVRERVPLPADQCATLARALARTLASMEAAGLAHCALGGAHVLLPALASEPPDPAGSDVGLVDVEHLCGPALPRPASPPAVMPGYAPPGLAPAWAPTADRLAGAILLAEALAWSDPAAREAAAGASYFAIDEVSQPSARADRLARTLAERHGEEVARLFWTAWISRAPAECPTFADWHAALGGSPDQIRLDASGHAVAAPPATFPRASAPPIEVAPAPQASATDVTGETGMTSVSSPAARALIGLAERLEHDGDPTAALALYRRAISILATEEDLSATSIGRRVGLSGTALLDLAAARPQWHERRSATITLRFMPGALAEANSQALIERLEALRTALLTMLAPSDLPPPTRITLVARLPDAAGGVDAVIRQGTIEALYHADNPGRGLEAAYVDLLLRQVLGRETAPARLVVDGLLGVLSLEIDRRDAAAVQTLLLAARRAGARLTIQEFLGGPGDGTTAPYHQIATSFVAFLLRAHGADAFRQFVARLDPAAPDQAAEAVYGRPLVVLDQAWLATVREEAPTIAGVGAFLRQAVAYLRPYWPQQLLIIIGLLLGLAFNIILPLSYSFLIDQAILPGDFGLVLRIITGLAALFIVQALAGLGKDYLSARVGARVAEDLRLQLLEHLQRLSMSFHGQARVGDLMTRLSSDLMIVEQALTRVLTTGLFLLLNLVVSAVILFFLEWRLALLTLVALPIFIIGPRLFGGRAGQASYARQQDNAVLASSIQENLAAQAIVKALGLEGPSLARLRQQARRLTESTVRLTFLSSLLGATAEMSVSFVQLLTLAVGAFMVVQGALSLGALVAFLGLLGNIIDPVQSLSKLLQAVQQSTGAMQRVSEVLHEPVEVADDPGAIVLPRPRRALRFEDVTFSYTGERGEVSHLTLTIPMGHNVAIVGPSGCGKSTVLSLIMRFYDPVAGRILIDGHDLRAVTQASLRAHLGVVPQDTSLFNMSLRENICLGRPDATDAEVEAAARAAEIHDLITGLPQGYETLVGERGGRLSGGQRQRIAIARAILRDPAILLLDEATSALDPQTEAAITSTLRRLARDRTVIQVTHRLASIADADQIIVLEQGRLVEQGAHADLLVREGLYARLWRQQMAGQVLPSPIEPADLQAIPLFQRMDGILLTALADGFVTERFDAGESIIEEGQFGDTFHVITEGQAEVVTAGATGERRLAILRSGDYFGEMALLNDAPRMATVRALTPTTTVTLDQRRFRQLLETIPGLQTAFEEVVEARRQMNRVQTPA